MNHGKIAFCGTAAQLSAAVGKRYVIHVKTQQGDSTYETDSIEDTLMAFLSEIKGSKNKILDIQVNRGSLEQHFMEMARREEA